MYFKTFEPGRVTCLPSITSDQHAIPSSLISISSDFIRTADTLISRRGCDPSSR